ncbi:MAG TPA: glycosyltransferase family 2 protein [Bacteroidia bacterium]|jgi:glycosyltransferase involved in cell wall biosynthesis|nr:glycosyltransferase family 2 protein [Bacteroidia bacterium]
MKDQPKITIITVVFNAQALIEQTIQSVLQQTYPFIEYIIIDGASTDGTLQLIDRYKAQLAFISSEKDQGLYDAMNKGLKKATGEYVLFLNAGDVLNDADVLQAIFTDGTPADVYYGNTKIIDAAGSVLGERRLTPPEKLTWRSLKFGMCVSHQSFIPKRTLVEPYDLRYKLSSDIDWVIRVLKKANTIVNTHITISKFLEGGVSSKRRKKALIERFKIMVTHYGLLSTLFSHAYILVRYPFHKLTRKSMS